MQGAGTELLNHSHSRFLLSEANLSKRISQEEDLVSPALKPEKNTAVYADHSSKKAHRRLRPDEHDL